MRLLRGRVSRVKPIRSGWSHLTELCLEGERKVLLQTHQPQGIQLGDELVLGGFDLFGRFMVVSYKNLRTHEAWGNPPWALAWLGGFTASVPVLTNNPNRIFWVDLGFYLIGAGLVLFALAVFRVSRRVLIEPTRPDQPS
jgi:hypothetical protein